MYNTHIHTHIPWTGWKPTENSKLETSFTVAIIYGILQYHLMISSFHKVCHGTGFLSCRRHHICTLALRHFRDKRMQMEKHGEKTSILKASEDPTKVQRRGTFQHMFQGDAPIE